MSDYKNDLINILEMLLNIEKDLNLVGYNQTEKTVYYAIAWNISKSEICNITDVIISSKLSRSTVYKAIKKFELNNLVKLEQSSLDKREYNLTLSNI